MAKKEEAREVLVIASKIKAHIRDKKMMCASDMAGALSAKVRALLDDACARTKANGRATVRAGDL